MTASTTGPTLGSTSVYYGGGQVPNPANVIPTSGAPSTAAIHNRLGTLAIDNANKKAYVLNSLLGGVANWALFASAAGAVETLTGDSGGAIAPSAGNINLTGGTGISITGSGSTLTFNVVGEGEKTVTATATTQMAPNTSYFVPQLASCTLTLPLNASCSLGDVVTVYGVSTNFFTIAQNAAQQVNISTQSTTAGIAGSITSKETFDSVTLKYCGVISAVGQWVATAVSGTYTFA